MPSPEWRLWLGLASGLLLVQALAWLLARGLRLRLSRAALAGGVLLPLALLAPWLDGDPLLVPCNQIAGLFPGTAALSKPDPHALLNDVIYQFLPWELEVRHAFADGRLPFWSDLLEGGSSPWANPQAAVLSPLALPARLVPIQHHLLAMLIFKVLVAFEGTWLLARRLGRSRAASLLAAGGYALSGGLLAWALFPHSAAAAWVPWLAAGTVGLFRRPRGRVLATTAAIAAALLLSGHPETAAIGALFAGLCGLVFHRRGRLLRGAGAAALAAALGFGLAAPHLLPFLSLLPESQRAEETLAQEATAHEVRLAEPWTLFELGRGPFVLSPLSPHAYGRPFRDPFRGPVNWSDAESGYAGLLALAGTLVALCAVRDRRVLPLATFAVLCLLLPARLVPLSRLLHLIPALRVPAYARFLLVGCLALALVGAFGLDRLLGHRPAEPRRKKRAGKDAGAPSGARRGLGVWIGLALAAALSLAVAADPHTVMLWVLLLLAALIALLPAGTGWARHRRPLAAALLGLALLLDQIPWGRSLLPAGLPGLFYPRTAFLDELAAEVKVPAEDRVVGGDFLAYPSLLSVYGLADPRPHNPLAPRAYLRVLRGAFGFAPTMGDYFSGFHNLDHPLLDFLGVRAVMASVAVPPSRTLQSIAGERWAPFYLLRNPDPLPRWFVPAAAEILPEAAIEGWIARLDRPGRVALPREDVGSWRPVGLDGSVHPVRLLPESPGQLHLALPATPAAETLIASSVPFSPGWKATASGRALPLVHVHGAFLGIRVPPGTTRLDLRFRPPGLLPGVAFCLVSLFACGYLLARDRRGSRSRGTNRQRLLF